MKKDTIKLNRQSRRQDIRRVKIVCTKGPSSSSKKTINELIKAGMNVARLNFSHGTHKEHRRAVGNIRKAGIKFNVPVAVLQDLKGLKIRVGSLKNGFIILKKNSTLVLTVKDIIGDSKQVSVSYPHLIKDVKIGDKILLDDGLFQVKVTGKGKDSPHYLNHHS
ncbi:MAG: pyruvate kinase, partial [Candidatus Mariimomonas ferrooxydans]